MGVTKSTILGLLVITAFSIGMWGLPHVAPQSATMAQVLATNTVSPTMTPKKLVTNGDKVGDKIPVTILSPTLSPINLVMPTVLATVSATPTPIPYTSLTPTPLPSSSPTAALTQTPSPGSSSAVVVINEVAWMGTEASSTDEWIELFNPAEQVIDLNGWKILIAGDNAITLSGTIAAKGYYLLERTDDTVVSDVAADYTGPFGRYGLSDNGERITLVDGTGAVIDDLSCANGWFAGMKDKGAKASMERIGAPASDGPGSNWASNNSSITIGHDAQGGLLRATPRGANSVSR